MLKRKTDESEMARSATPTLQKPLRLWPGVVALVLLWLARFGLKAVIPGFAGFSTGMMWSFGAAAAVVLWWAFFSRVPWLERLCTIVLMIVGLAGTWYLRHESMGPLWLVGYAVPSLCLALVGGAAASRRLPDGPRRATMAATILVACGAWTLVRTEGISGDHVAEFGWRWAKSPEERLLAQADREPPAGLSAPAVGTPKEQPTPQASNHPAGEPTVPVAVETPKELDVTQVSNQPAALPGAPDEVKTGGNWPGFRGPQRDGTIPGVLIETNWAASPPVELWRRPIGPAWSSFAVHGNLIYTQEQRGEDEIISCYNATTGEPVWTHRDAARFFESNAGVGPRGTPTISNGRVYTLGATGIMNALDASDGAVVWSRNVASDTGVKVPPWGFSSSSLVLDDLVIIAASGQLVAYDLATGDLRWSGPAGAEGYSSPHLVTLDGVAQILLMSGTGATSVAPADGKVLWEYAWKGFPIVQPALIPNSRDDILIVASGGSGARRITVAHGPGGWTIEERWTSLGLKPYFNDFVVHDDHAFGFDGRILACIDLQDGQRKWKGGRYGSGQLILLRDQDLLLVLSEEGELALVAATAEQFKELARFPAIEGKTWNHPVLVGDILLVRNGQEMVAFRLSLTSI
jgi:outer membrane protein assembly factor BamB